MKKYRPIDLIGNTPMVELPSNMHNTNNLILVKLEYFNPTKSLKDRIALFMIEEMEKQGKCDKNTTFIEPSSGNTGISLAYVCSIKGYRLIIAMSDSMSIERRKMIKYFGAELVLVDSEKGFQGMIDKAYDLADGIDNSIVLNQYFNKMNVEAHKVTGKEIYEQSDGLVDVLIAGVGTSGFITGASTYIRQRKDLYTIVVDPEDNDILEGGNQYFPHSLQGIGPNLVPGNYDSQIIDRIFKVSKENAYSTSRNLARNGIPAGISTGASAYAAMDYARDFENKTICFLACDFCERYVSTDLFDF